MKEFKCITTCTYGGRLFQAGDPLKVSDDEEVPKHFKQVGGEVKAKTAISLTEALDLLDNDNDDHWTQKGLPDVKAVEAIMGEGADVSRADIEEAAPDLKRQAS